MNTLEEKTKEILRRNNWEVLSNIYYKDSITEKPREKDIIATSLQFKERQDIAYKVRLFIECKHFPQKTEIYPGINNIDKIKNTILSFNIPFFNIAEIEHYKKTHFYKYFKNKEIFTTKDGNDFLYKTINQNLQSFDAFRKNNPEKGLYYLIIVYDGIKPIFQNKNYDRFLVNIETIDDVFNLPNKQCFIEITHINELENLLNEVMEDVKEINFSIHFYYKMSKNNPKKIIRNQYF